MVLRDSMMELYYRNYPLIPLKKNSKKPAVSWEPYIRRVPTYDEYKEWAEEGLFETGYGIVTGKVSGLTVLDVDFKHGGMESLHEKDIQILDTITWAVDTPNGRHYYFKYNKQAKTGANRLGEGVDIRNDGGFVVGPGSSVEGKVYQWANEYGPEEVELADAPGWLLEGPDRRIDKPLTDFGEPIKDGERNNKLASLGGAMIKTFSIKRVPFGVAMLATQSALEEVNANWCEIPLDDDEIRAITRSVSRYYVQH